MNSKASFIAGMLLLAGAPLAPASAAEDAPSSREAKGAAELARALEGRVAGEPVDCIYQRNIRSTRIIDRTAIIYETNGGDLYVNQPASGAGFLDQFDTLVTDTRTPQLCSIDIVRLVDMSTRMPSGTLGLGKFVPYTRPDKRP